MKDMVQELKRNGAILEEEDFMGYSAREHEPVQSEFNGLKVIGAPPPCSGAVLAVVLNILQGKKWHHTHKSSLLFNNLQVTTSQRKTLAH